jgi:hypothetical protein
MLISGEPNTYKTTSLLTFPRPLVYLAYPGEKGHAVIPASEPDIFKYVWQTDDPTKPESPTQVLADVRKVTTDALCGLHGKDITFAGDGLHKLHGYMLNAVTSGAYFKGDEFEPRLYGRATEMFLSYLALVAHSTINVAVFTVWSGQEPDRTKKPGERAGDIPAHTYPELPGKLAKRIIGEFEIVVGSVLRSPKPGAPLDGLWQLRPEGDIRGVGVKIAPDVAKALPVYCAADYRVLNTHLTGGAA